MTETTGGHAVIRRPARWPVGAGSPPRRAVRRSGASSSSGRGCSASSCSPLGPIIASLIISLTDFNLVHPEAVKFIGIDNYVPMASDPNVAQSLLVTFKFALIAIPRHHGREPRARRCW